MSLISVSRYLLHRKLLSSRLYLYAPIRNTRALSSSLNHGSHNQTILTASSSSLHLSTNQSLNFSVLVGSRRNLATTPSRRQKDDDDKDKEKEKKRKEEEKRKKEMEAQMKEFQANWDALSGFGKTFVVFIAAGISAIIADALLNSETQQNGQATVTLNELSDLLYQNKAKNLVYNTNTRSLYFRNEDNFKDEQLANIDIASLKAHIDKLYDSMGLAFASRQHITIDSGKKNAENVLSKVSGFFKTAFSEHWITLGMIFYFSIVVRIKNARGGGSANPFQAMLGQMQNNAKPGKKGKKGKSNTNNSPGGLFGQMQPQSDMGTLIEPDEIDVGFKDVAGCEEAKVEVIEIVDFLRNRQKYEKAGAEVPKGAIYHGPPGTGKTLLAKACAKEAGVNFIQCSGSDFIEMYVGLGSKRVRSLFEKARDNAPSILFIDEIDSVGSKRGGGMGGGNSEANQTINSILAEMDGFNTGKIPVVVMAATNRLDSLDSALLRPGRFDRKIYVGAPDVEGRAKIFNVHLKKINTADDKDELAKYLAVKTPGMAGAEIKNICNEAALHSVRNGDPKITKDNFEKAVDRVIAGMEKTNSLLDPEVKRRIAIHEAGHAVTSWFLKNCMPLVKVTITPRTEGTLGFAMYQPDTNKVLQEKEYFLDQMVSTLAGRAAEDVFYKGTVSSGAHDDLKKVTSSAYNLVMRLGMGEKIRNLNFHDAAEGMGQGAHQIFPSQKTRELLDIEIQEMVDQQYKRAFDLVTEKKDEIEKMADKLMEKETLLREDVIEILGPRPFEDNMSYEAQTKHSKNEEFKLPPGLRHWEKSFRYKDSNSSSDDSSNNNSTTADSSAVNGDPELTGGWRRAYADGVGDYYENQSIEQTSMRHPGKKMPAGWSAEVDSEGRTEFVHKESGFRSWILEEDPALPKALKKEIEESKGAKDE